ncbi:MAG: cytidine deaminase [Candidatus Gottesmanbacteria bacterium]|nr:cytidine deaminase [Candidatus Gottesmanbacteria bacterium]
MKENIDKLVWVPSPREIAVEKLLILNEIEAIGLPWLENLAHTAAIARKRAYIPQTGYGVGAAMLDTIGDEHSGQNVEITTLSETGHAEEQSMKNAIDKSVIQRMGRRFVRAVAVSHEGDTSPCGRCRQIMKEFSDNALVIIADPEGEIRRITSLRILLPDAFGPKDLGIE